MKKIEVTQFTHAEVEAPTETFGYLKIPTEHKKFRAEGENLVVSDGYHTMEELYEHRITLYIALCKMHKSKVWRAIKHSDGTSFDGWFVLGINKEKGKQITYHLPMERWQDCDNWCETLSKAPEWDSHTPQDVLGRINLL